jgi:hypothetical protein
LILSLHLRLGIPSKWSPPLTFSNQILYAFISHAYYIPRPYHPSRSDCHYNIWWRVQMIKAVNIIHKWFYLKLIYSIQKGCLKIYSMLNKLEKRWQWDPHRPDDGGSKLLWNVGQTLFYQTTRRNILEDSYLQAGFLLPFCVKMRVANRYEIFESV